MADSRVPADLHRPPNSSESRTVLASALLSIFNNPFSPFRIDRLRKDSPNKPRTPFLPSQKAKLKNKMSAAVAASLASGGVESVNFLNDIIAQLWDYINVAGSTMTKDIVEPIFKETLPTPLNSLHFKKIDLGKTPIKFDNIDVHSRREGVIKLDVDVFWDGQCDIQLSANIIGGFGVRHIKLAGRMSVVLCPLVDRMPLVTAMQLAFVNPPQIALDFTGLAQVADFSLIDDSVRGVIHQVLSSILVLPNRMLVKVDPSNIWYDTYQQHLGFLRLTVVSGRGFKTPKGWIKDIPDIYCKVKLGAHKEWHTETKKNDTSPEWEETADFLLSDHDQMIMIEAMDDDLARDDKLGTGRMTVGELLMAGRRAEVPLLIDEADTGATVTVRCDIMQFVPDVSSVTDGAHSAPGLCSGMLTVLVAGARNIPSDRREAASSVKVTIGEKEFVTPVVMDVPGVDAINPAFDAAFRVPLTVEKAGEAPDVTMTLINKKKELGSTTVKYEEIVAATDATLTNEYSFANGACIMAKIIVSGIVAAQ